jgi:hypothetical protein
MRGLSPIGVEGSAFRDSDACFASLTPFIGRTMR